MSMYYAKHDKRYVPKYEKTRTKQAFKDSADINKILKLAQKKGGLAHVEKYPEQVYGEFDGEMDLLTAHERMERANEIFMDLPSEVRGEFNNNPLEFVTWAAAQPPGAIVEKIPQIAEEGSYFPNPAQRGGQGAALATAPTEGPAGAGNPAPQGTPQGNQEVAPTATTEGESK